jgi:hypothetical protein
MPSGGPLSGPPEAADQFGVRLPPARKNRSSFIPVLLIVGSVGLVGLGCLVVTVVLIAGAINDAISQSNDKQIAPPEPPQTVAPEVRSFPQLTPPAAAPSAAAPVRPSTGLPSDNDRQDEEFFAAVDKFIARLEQFASELSAVHDLNSAVAIESRLQDTAVELRLAQTELTLQSHRTSTNATRRFMLEYRPRIDEVNRRIQTETRRIEQLLRQEKPRRPVPAWGKDGPPRP